MRPRPLAQKPEKPSFTLGKPQAPVKMAKPKLQANKAKVGVKGPAQSRMKGSANG